MMLLDLNRGTSSGNKEKNVDLQGHNVEQVYGRGR